MTTALSNQGFPDASTISCDHSLLLTYCSCLCCSTNPPGDRDTVYVLTIRTELNGSMSAGWHYTHMTKTPQAQSCWNQLSIELCNAIFTQVASRTSMWEPMGELYKLPLVCTRFRDTFKQDSHLQSVIRLQCVPSREKLPSLLSWIQRYGSAVREYTHCNSPDFELALGALLSHGAPLHTLMLGEPPETLHLVAAFTTIRHCSLETTWETPPLDLQPMQAMPELVHLTLIHGTFDNLQAAARHLTRLSLQQCIAECMGSCMCTTSLLELELEEANLEGFNDRGIVECCCLQALDCCDSCVRAGHELHQAENLNCKAPVPQVPQS